MPFAVIKYNMYNCRGHLTKGGSELFVKDFPSLSKAMDDLGEEGFKLLSTVTMVADVGDTFHYLIYTFHKES